MLRARHSICAVAGIAVLSLLRIFLWKRKSDAITKLPIIFPHSDTKKGAMNSVYHRVRSYMLKRKARLVAHEAHRKTGRLLDIGTGTGYFADTMNRAGWQVEAVEKNAGARVFAKEHFGLK